ncbi:MarR family transcriptional regulator [Knoellia locipacati]|uniref:MarR family winged helix-turn-helix transcriptional regulator n=1 Tax=Knoellia locipacati TaxID=882824 RepID=UPI00384BACC5
MGRERHLFADDQRREPIHHREPGFSARWERVDRDDPRNLPILLRQASSAVDRMMLRALAPCVEPTLGRLSQRTMVDVDLLLRVAERVTTPTQLAEYLDRHRSTVGHRLDHLEQAGLVRRVGHARESRRCAVVLTEEGTDLARAIESVLADLADEISEDLPPTRWASLMHDLSALSDVR